MNAGGDDGRSALGRSWMPQVVLALGILSVALLLLTDQFRQRSIVRDLELLKAVGQIQRDAAVSHLWLEEHVSGDQVDVLDIYARLDRAEQRAQDMIGAARPGGLRTVPTLDDEDLRRQAGAMAIHIEEFREISFERQEGLEQGLEVGIGSALDVRYDAVFGLLVREAQQLEQSLETRMRRSRSRSRLVFRGILVAWCGIVLLAAVGLSTRERRRQQAEAALRESQHHLAQSQKMEAVGRLAGGLAHDLYNYLAAVRGHCELVSMRHGEDAWISGKMDAAVRVVGKATSLIERLQTFSRRQPLQLEVLNLNPVVSGLEKVMAPSVGEEIRIETELAGELWNIRIDPTQIEQVLVNLVLNSREAMPDGGTIRIRTANVRDAESKEDLVLLEVSDTGTGIPPELRDRIFEPFLSTKAQNGRRGLGLAIVYSVVEQHGGHIELESAVGAGTTFRVYLPACKEPLTHVDAPAEDRHENLRGSECILLVDDNDEFRNSTRDLLASQGYRVLAAAGGEQALELFARHGDEVDLVVADVVMPDLSGPELLSRLRQVRPVKALLLSGHTDHITLRHGVARGEVPFLKKLFSAQDLARVVRSLLDEHDRA